MGSHSRKCSILMAAAECAPFAKVGGLGDVLGSLPQALANQELQVSVIIPKYGCIDAKKFKLRKIKSGIHFKHNEKEQTCSVYHSRLPKNNVDYYFVDHPLFRGKDVYIGTHGQSASDAERFPFFSHAVVEILHQLRLKADIIHCHDWHAALIPTYVDQLAITHSYPFTKTVFTIHNLPNQGLTNRSNITKLDLSPETTPSLLEDYYDLDRHQLNFMKLGILSADRITTVSPAYAQEILSKEYGAGLASFLLRRGKDLSGIINGIDTGYFNPAHDPYIKYNYSIDSFKKNKQLNKKDLQKTVGLPFSEAPLYGMVSRLTQQKGLDILERSLNIFARSNIQVIVLGTGEKKLEAKLANLAKRSKRSAKVIIGFDLKLAQKIYAGSDFFLMPSHFEPCGLGQLIAMRYGTIPIVRATGGLKDTVRQGKTGIVFKPYTSSALSDALRQSLKLYGNKKSWYTMVTRCMQQDFSWKKSAKEYIKLYKKLV